MIKLAKAFWYTFKVNRHQIAFWLGLLILFTVFRLPAFFTPHYYVDEGMYASVAAMLHKGMLLYRDVYDHKPPLLFYIYASFGNYRILFKAKLASFLLGLLTICLIFPVIKKLVNPKAARLSTLFAAVLIGSNLLEGSIANAEVFYLPLLVGALYFLVAVKQAKYFWAGLLLGIAFLIKFQPILTALALGYFLFFENGNQSLNFKKLFPLEKCQRIGKLFLGVATPWLFWALLEISRHNFGRFIQAAYLDAFSYSGYQFDTGNLLFNLLSSTLI